MDPIKKWDDPPSHDPLRNVSSDQTHPKRRGCLRFRGAARAMDVGRIMQDQRRGFWKQKSGRKRLLGWILMVLFKMDYNILYEDDVSLMYIKSCVFSIAMLRGFVWLVIVYGL